MGFFDELKRLTRPYDDRMDDEDFDEAEEEVYDDYEDDEPEEPAPPPREEPRRREYRQEYRQDPPPQQPRRQDNGKVVNIHATTQLQVVLVKPERYENASEVADHLRDKRTVVLNLEKTEKDVARRLLDFLSGVAYAQEGKIKKVALQTYIVTPYNVDIMGDLIDELENNGLYL
jgi:cell division inhibitor SepF